MGLRPLLAENRVTMNTATTSDTTSATISKGV
jgi:hypothetical protein